jgi:hypothetical protein
VPLLKRAAESLAPTSDLTLTWSSHLSASARMSSLQAFKAATSSWEASAKERVAYGIDLAGMSAGRLQAGKGRETAHAGSVGSKLGILEGLALHELWLRESQGPERRLFFRSFRSLKLDLIWEFALVAGQLVLDFEGLLWVRGLSSSMLVLSESLKSPEARKSFHSCVVLMEAPKSLAESRRFG